MVTYETLKTFKDKCDAALEEVAKSLDAARADVEMLNKQGVAISAQIDTLEQLMDVENNPPIVELPFVGDGDIEEAFSKRLETHEGKPEEEVYKDRQVVYKGEALETVDALDVLNNNASKD